MNGGSSDEPGLVQLARLIQVRCLERGLTLATAESCTGGLIAHLLTEVPGSSDYFIGAAVTYSDALKRGLLNVPGELLRTGGAVSADVAIAMAVGCRSKLGSDMAVSVTGIAGPDGGSPEKPVGLTYVAIADAAGHDVRRFVWSEGRSGNKRRSAEAALTLLLERLA